ncbi:MAG: permease prefix domain 1-containing protein, partial [Isosphaeraceae bacterium]
MDLRDSLAADLPAPRDDEPESLRDDILDELADHLACAYRREVMRGADAQTARQRVLERFGDPAALARRLWFDAMKGKIMKQRILVIYSIVLTLLFVGLVAMLLMQSVAAQRLAREALARAEAERARVEQAQQEMLEKLEAISRAAQSPRSPDWIPVTFKLTEETPDGPPAVGFEASLGKGDNGTNQAGAIHRESDDKGMIDFGVVQPGDWGYELRRRAEGGGLWRTAGKLNILPGTTIERTIICTVQDPKRLPLTVDIDWPKELTDRGLVVLAVLHHQGL